MAPDPAARALGPFIAYDAGVAVEHPGIGGDSGLDPSNKFIRVGLGETASTLNFPAQVAAARGIPRAQVALAWLLAKPVITAPIVGATKLQHLDDALASVRVKLSEDEMALLEEPYVPTRWSDAIRVRPRSAGSASWRRASSSRHTAR